MTQSGMQFQEMDCALQRSFFDLSSLPSDSIQLLDAEKNSGKPYTTYLKDRRFCNLNLLKIIPDSESGFVLQSFLRNSMNSPVQTSYEILKNIRLSSGIPLWLTA
jgi:hypothetical protein